MRRFHIVRIGYPLAVWLVLAVLAVRTGAFRETVLISMMDSATAHLLSTVLLVGSILLVGYAEGIPSAETIAQYDVFAGEVWSIVLLTLLVSPLVFGWYLQR